jgi:hypothetical protein
MDAPVVAAALAEMARGDAHAARARNAPRDANLTSDSRGSGPSPAPPSRAGVSAPRDARGRDHERARSHWLLLTGVLVGVLFSNAVHSTSASGAVLGSASASETVSDARASNPFAASVWRDVVAGSFGKASERASSVAGAAPISATEFPKSVLAYGAGLGDKLGRSLLRTLDASSFAFGSSDDKPATLAEWRKSSPSRDENEISSSHKRTVDVLGLANCPRLRVARDLLLGDGAVAELLGVAEFRTAKRPKSSPRAPTEKKTATEKKAKTTTVASRIGDDDSSERSSESRNDDSDPEPKRVKLFFLRVLPLALFFLCPGVVIALRAHELWGLDSVAGAGAVAFGFALCAMWCQGSLELYARWYECPTRRRRARTRAQQRRAARVRRALEARGGLRSLFFRFAAVASESVSELVAAFADFRNTAAFRVWMSRGVYPGLARAAMLEVFGLVSYIPRFVEWIGAKTPFGVVYVWLKRLPPSSAGDATRFAAAYLDGACFVAGAVFLPLFRVSYRAWYVTSRQRGSRRWSDARESYAVFARRRDRSLDDDENDDFQRSSDDETRSLISRDFAFESDYDGRDVPGGDWTEPLPDGTERRTPRSPEEVAAHNAIASRARRQTTALSDSFARERRFGGAFVDVAVDDDDDDGSPRPLPRPAGGPRLHTPNVTSPPSGNVRSPSSSSGSSHSALHWPEPVRLPEWLDEEKAPRHFRCPITLCVLREPAVTPAGISYERSALMQWLEHAHTEPSTKRRLKRSRVVPNLTLRAMIEDWLADERAERRARAARRAERSFRDEVSRRREKDGKDKDARNLFAKDDAEAETEAGDANASASLTSRDGAKRGFAENEDDAFGAADGSAFPAVASNSDSEARLSASSLLRRPGLPARAGAVSQETRDALRAARQRMYAALKRRAASGVSAEEQRWADILESRGGTTGQTRLSSSAETRGGFFRDDTVATSSRSSTDGASSSRRDDLDASGSRTRLEASADDRFRSATSQSAGGFFAAADAEDSALDTTIEDVLALDQDPYL